MSTEALVAIGACFLLIALVVATMRDKKPRFRLEPTAPPPSATPVPTSTPSPLPPPPPGDLQALFIQARAESPLLVEPYASPTPLPNTDFAQQPVYREIHEVELGKIYASAPRKDRRALAKVASLGGFKSPEQMAVSFGYQSVDQMLQTWDQTIAANPQFVPDTFGTNALPVLPVDY